MQLHADLCMLCTAAAFFSSVSSGHVLKIIRGTALLAFSTSISFFYPHLLHS
jgi:hypothetical protein